MGVRSARQGQRRGFDGSSVLVYVHVLSSKFLLISFVGHSEFLCNPWKAVSYSQRFVLFYDLDCSDSHYVVMGRPEFNGSY